MYDGYLEVGGTEVFHNARAAAYATSLGITSIRCAGCDTLTPAAAGNPLAGFSDPQTDDAPWYDPAVPESKGVAGFYVLGTSGFGSTLVREPTPLLRDGSAVGRGRYNHREIVYTVLVLATDDCAMSYALAWLSSALRGGVCGDCSGDTACLYVCCPPAGSDGEAQRRELFDVALMAGPTVTERQVLRSGIASESCTVNRPAGASSAVGGGLLYTVEVTIAVGRPWLFYPPKPILTDGKPAVTLAAPLKAADCIEWVTDGSGCDDGEYDDACPPGVSCLHDPYCPLPAAPPRAPIPADPCAEVCYSGATADTYTVTVPPADTPSWLDTVPVLSVFTGSAPMRGLQIRFHANPTGAPCNTGDLDPCSACAGISVPYLPASSLLTVDGRTERVSLDCSSGRGQTVDEASGLVFDRNGRAFSWPVFECAGFCVELSIQSDKHADDARAELSIVHRQDAA